ncbi:hypothetical protein AKG08_25225 [Achromobacter piechaudii]|nr:hypothetical protein AKG08_25225 [Achromobacter piechaudii]
MRNASRWAERQDSPDGAGCRSVVASRGLLLKPIRRIVDYATRQGLRFAEFSHAKVGLSTQANGFEAAVSCTADLVVSSAGEQPSLDQRRSFSLINCCFHSRGRPQGFMNDCAVSPLISGSGLAPLAE